MTNGTRGSALAFFFVLGMGFMGAMFLLAHPEWEWHDRARVIEEPAKTKLVSYTRTRTEVVSVPAAVEAPPPEPAPQAIVPETPKPEPVRAQPIVLEPQPTPVVQAQYYAPAQPSSPAPVKKVARAQAPLSVRNDDAAKTLKGRVFLEGKPPPPQEMSVDRICSQWLGPTVKSQTYVVGSRGELKDVLIVVDASRFDRRWPVPREPLVITSEKCQFEPYVSAIQFGQALQLDNRDPQMHGAHLIGPTGVKGATYALFPKAPPSHFVPELSENWLNAPYVPFVTVKCDVNPWMYSYVSIVPHPYFDVTDAEGKFEIKGLPKGVYRVIAHHRRAGKVEVDVEVGGSGAEVEFRIPLRKS